MNKSLFKRLLFLITFTVTLVAIVVKFDGVLASFVKGLSVIQPLLLGAVIAFVLNRPFKACIKVFQKILPDKIKLKHIKSVALLFTYLLFVGIAGALSAFVIPQFTQSIQLLYDNMDNYFINFQKIVANISSYLRINNIDLSTFENTVKDLPALVGGSLGGVLPGVYDFTTGIIGSLLNLVLGLILSIYILADKDHLKKQFNSLFKAYIKPKPRNKIEKVLTVSYDTFGNFVTGQLTEAAILGVLCFIGMLLFKFEYALLISVLIGITSIIPVVGAIIGLVPSLFILLLVNPGHALGFFIFIMVLMQIEGNLIYPRVVGGSVGLPSLWVLSALIVGGGLFGILGMLVGIPLSSVIYHLLKDNVEQRLNEIKST